MMFSRLVTLLILTYLSAFASPVVAASSAPLALISGYRIVHAEPSEFVSALRTSTSPTKTSVGSDKASRLSYLFDIRKRTLSGGSVHLEIVPNFQRLGTEVFDGLATSVDLSQMNRDENGFRYVMQVVIPSGYVFNGTLTVEKHRLGSLLSGSVARPNEGLMPVKFVAESVMSVLGLSETPEAAERADLARERMHD